MKTLIQKIFVEENQSFACRTYTTPNFETNWHQHEEYELILITQGYGTIMIGDYVGEYKTGEVYFIAGNLPHWFRKNHPKMVGSAIVCQFKKDFFGKSFLLLPELKNIQSFLLKKDGIQLQQQALQQVATKLTTIEKAKGYERLMLLLDCLQCMALDSQKIYLTKNFIAAANNINPAIEKIIDYSFNHYLEPITLAEVAAVAEMSIPTFCRFFKKNLKKTYFDFLQDVRISHACKLLANSNKTVLEVCYESGYNSWAHFSKQFKQVKQCTPTAYRKQFE